MKVFYCKMTGGYCGGLIIVAANNLEEAIEVAKEYDEDIDTPSWPCYKSEDFRECSMLEALVNTPQVLLEDAYIE